MLTTIFNYDRITLAFDKADKVEYQIISLVSGEILKWLKRCPC